MRLKEGMREWKGERDEIEGRDEEVERREG